MYTRKEIPSELFRPQTFTLDKRKKWWICSKLIIGKGKMEWKCVHVDAIMRISVLANRIAHPSDRTRLDFGLEEKARFEWENETAAKVRFATKTIVDFGNRCCRCTTYTSIAQFFFSFASCTKVMPNLLSKKKTLHTTSPNVRWIYVLKQESINEAREI